MYDSAPDFSGLIYLDNAATSFPKPPQIIEKMSDFYRRFGVSPGRSSFDMSKLSSEMVDRTREKLCALFGGSDPDRLIFCANATDALNMIIYGVLKENDHVITTVLEHNSVIRPLNHLIREINLEVDFVTPDSSGIVDPETVRAAIKQNTRMVIINHSSNVIGTVQPLTEIGAICKDNGLFFAVDAAQSAGIIPIDIVSQNIDALAFTGHKSLLGPTGTGGFLLNETATLKPTKTGGTGYNSIEPFQPDRLPYKHEAGTLNVLGIAGLYYALEYLEKEGIGEIHTREMKLFAALQQSIASLERVTIYGSQNLHNRLPVLNFNISGIEAGTLATILDVDYNIASRKGLHCAPMLHQHLGTPEYGSVRLSLGAMNTEADIDATVRAIKEIAEGKAGY